MIKELALGSGLLIMPQWLCLISSKKPIQIIVIGDLSTMFMKKFYEKESEIHYTYLGWQDYNPFSKDKNNNSFIELDLSPISGEDCTNSKSCQKIIIDALLPAKNYVFVTNLLKPQIELSKSILEWVNEQSIDFRFFGTTPLFNSSLIKMTRFTLKEFENDPRVSIIDINDCLNNMDGTKLFTEAAEELDKTLADRLYDMCLSF